MRHRLPGAALLAAALLPLGGGTTAAQDADDRVQVLHVSIDSLAPSQLEEDAELVPFLRELRDAGTWWTQARGVMAAETLPNHVAMGTGTYPGSNGIPGNNGRLRAGDTANAEPDLGLPEARRAVSTVAAVEQQCPDLRTVTVFSKDYVWRTFQDEADADFFQPDFNIPGSGHAPDVATVDFLLEQLGQGSVDYAFVNLGDHDRASHLDDTGALPAPDGGVLPGPRTVQRAALAQVDVQLRRIVTALQDSGDWQRTVLLVSSDHSMSFSVAADPRFNVDVGAALEEVEVAAGREPGSTFLPSFNGGAAFVYLVDPDDPERDALLADARAAVAELDGVDELLYREPNAVDRDGPTIDGAHPDWRLGATARTGDLLVLVEPAFRTGAVSDNPLPGNHGHTVTRHVTALVTGGWDGVAAGQVVEPSDPAAVDVADDTAALPEQAEQVDWAPTIGWLLGVEDPGEADGDDAQWQGRVLEEAFERRPGVQACAAASPGTVDPGTDQPAPDPGTDPATGRDPAGDAPDPAPADDAGGPRLPATGGGLLQLGLALCGAALLLRRPGAEGRRE